MQDLISKTFHGICCMWPHETLVLGKILFFFPQIAQIYLTNYSHLHCKNECLSLSLYSSYVTETHSAVSESLKIAKSNSILN